MLLMRMSIQNVVSTIQENVEMSITMIEERSPVASFSVTVEQGECSISKEELSEELEKP